MTNAANMKKVRPAPATKAGDERSNLIDLWLGLYASDPDCRESIGRFAVSQELAAEQIVGTYGDENAAGQVSWARLNAGMFAISDDVGKVEGVAAR